MVNAWQNMLRNTLASIEQLLSPWELTPSVIEFITAIRVSRYPREMEAKEKAKLADDAWEM